MHDPGLCVVLRSYEATATLTTKSIRVKTDRTDQCPAREISETVAVVPILRQAFLFMHCMCMIYSLNGSRRVGRSSCAT